MNKKDDKMCFHITEYRFFMTLHVIVLLNSPRATRRFSTSPTDGRSRF